LHGIYKIIDKKSATEDTVPSASCEAREGTEQGINKNKELCAIFSQKRASFSTKKRCLAKNGGSFGHKFHRFGGNCKKIGEF